MRKFLLLSLLVGIAACAGDGKSRRLDDSLNHYSDAIRWGQFDQANTFHEPAYASNSGEAFTGIRVTGYDTVASQTYEDQDQFEQTVRISYYRESEGTERKITQLQKWRFNPIKKLWTLYSPMPAFPEK